MVPPVSDDGVGPPGPARAAPHSQWIQRPPGSVEWQRALGVDFARAAAAGDGHLVVAGFYTATPRFDPEFRVTFDLSPESWAKVRTALEQQDEITRCGLAFDPDKVFAQLQELVGKGFVIHLPRKLLRTVTLPVGVSESVEVEGRRVGVVVTRNAIRITPAALWYSIDVRADIAGAPRPDALRTPRP